ncbi:hypothetical protein [Methanobrevibacter sp.]
MSIAEKIKRSWWILLSFIFMLNGFGFVYAGFKNNNWKWVIEGVIYEIPWLFSFFYANTDLLNIYIRFALVLMLISIIRSIWLAIKLADVYDNEEKYSVRPTVINNHNNPKRNDNSLTNVGCCLCLIVIFTVFALVAIL